MEKKTLSQVKAALAEKQVRLAKVASSKGRRVRLLRLAEKFHRQAADLAR